MALPERPRSLLATVVGWVILAIIAWLVLGFVLGAVRWLLRGLVWAVVIGGLVWLYLWLRAPDD